MTRLSQHWKTVLAIVLATGMLFCGMYQDIHAQGSNRVALIISYGEDKVATYCVTFAEPELTGLDVLSRAGLEVVYSASGMGAMICKIGERGCSDAGNCLCLCQGASCVYWSYWHLVDGAWQYSIEGASSYRVKSGAVEGWTWGAGSLSSAPRPPALGFDEVCRATVPTATSAATRLSIETPTMAPTVLPTSTTTATAVQTAAPVSTLTPDSTCTISPLPTVPAPTAIQTAAPTASPGVITGVVAPTSASISPSLALSPMATPKAVSGLGNYAFFLALVVVLGVVGFIVLRKRT